MPCVYRFFLALMILLTSCMPTLQPNPTLPPTDTPQPSFTLTPTPTILWFPPTATYTPFSTPVITPTQDMRPGLGTSILSDDFTDSSLWFLNSTPQGSVAFGNKELTIAISAPKIYLFSLRKDTTFSDFYLEITTSPNMCQGMDEYGLLFRVSVNMDYYRFSLSCDGHVRLDRVAGGQASSPQTWMLSGAFPPGAPNSSRLAVWALGTEMHFFINDYFQFSVNDPLLRSGALGVFARSTGNTAVTVNFSDLQVRAIISSTP